MYKRHFVEASKIVRDIPNKAERKRSAIRFATLFRKFGPNFDEDRFFSACEVKK